MGFKLTHAAIYTINTPEEQTQDIAFSYDGGFTFEKYANNPVIRPGGTNPVCKFAREQPVTSC